MFDMQAKYDKAITVGMAGVLLLFISVYISMDLLSINLEAGQAGMGIFDISWFIGIIASIIVSMIVVGFISALVSSEDISSYREACEVSVLSGAVPASIIFVGLAYLIYKIGLLDSLDVLIAGLIVVASCLIFSALGGTMGYKFTHKTSS